MMKAVSFRGFAQYEIPKQTAWGHRQNNRCRVCDAEITDQAYYCTEHGGFKIRLNRQMRRWVELEEKLDRGIITLDEAKVIRVWP